jgi:hypothetical protein
MLGDPFRRPPPAKPYKLGSDELVVPRNAIVATLELLQRAGNRESGLFWYGSREAGVAAVRAVIAPRQIMRPRNYEVSPDAMREIDSFLDETHKPIAQVHSHPSVAVEHSAYDDTQVISRRVISIVVPRYGRGRMKWPSSFGIHEYQGGYWHQLCDEEAAIRVVVDSDRELILRDLR